MRYLVLVSKGLVQWSDRYELTHVCDSNMSYILVTSLQSLDRFCTAISLTQNDTISNPSFFP